MELVFATHNRNKLEEIKQIVPNWIAIVGLDEIGYHKEIIEDAETILGNAKLKAKTIKNELGLDCIADDTGLEVEALQGAPGVYSARYAGPEKNATANIAKLLKNLECTTNKSARFLTTIALEIDQKSLTFTGVCKGSIANSPAGERGFGYDPIFIPAGYTQTFAEMPIAQKNKISHRSQAMLKFLRYLQSEST